MTKHWDGLPLGLKLTRAASKLTIYLLNLIQQYWIKIFGWSHMLFSVLYINAVLYRNC